MSYRPKSTAVLSAALLSFAGVGAAAAQDPEPLSACYVPEVGALYLVGLPGLSEACLSEDHTQVTWSAGGAGGTSHGGLAGLEADDHPQYMLADGVRATTSGFAVTGTLDGGTIPVEGSGVRLMWYPGKAAFRAGAVEGDQWDDGSIGAHSVAMGENATASGPNTLAHGRSATASGSNSIAMGALSSSTAGGVAMGSVTAATGASATALGSSTSASGQWSTAMGFGTVASQTSATAFGEETTASGIRSTAMGQNTTASGTTSTALGILSAASGVGSLATGRLTTASGSMSTAMGDHTVASGENSTALGAYASTNAQIGSFVYGDRGRPTSEILEATAPNSFVIRAQRMWLGKSGSQVATSGRYLETSTGAYLSDGGTWTNASDVARKEGFRDEDAEAVLAKLAAMPIRSWSYREEEPDVRHLGPTAQDFRAAFGLGDGDKAISTVDADGVALLAIQALDLRTRELDGVRARIAALERANAVLRQELAALRVLMEGGPPEEDSPEPRH